MVNKKDLHLHTPGVYRDEPDRDDAASMSSAVLLDDIDSFPDEELPAYEDEPSQSALLPGAAAPIIGSRVDPFRTIQIFPPDLPFSTHGANSEEFRTRFPDYSTDPQTLSTMIQEQARFPPVYYVEISGTHTETRRSNNKETKDKITDFHFGINLTHLLLPTSQFPLHTADAPLELLSDNKRGYRGTKLPSLNPTVADVEEESALMAWCQRYVLDKARVKSFTLKRQITNHDTKKLEQLLRSAISETNYRGHVYIKFPITHSSVVVYSPGLINQWRTTQWIRWVFYLTFLWVFAWPVLFLITSRYEIVKSVWAYANKKPGDEMGREPAVMSEIGWFHRWESTVKRAALARTKCGMERCLDEEYREMTVAADERGVRADRNPQPVPSTGNAFADGAIGLLGQGLRVAENFSNARGWGGDFMISKPPPGVSWSMKLSCNRWLDYEAKYGFVDALRGNSTSTTPPPQVIDIAIENNGTLVVAGIVGDQRWEETYCPVRSFAWVETEHSKYGIILLLTSLLLPVFLAFIAFVTAYTRFERLVNTYIVYPALWGTRHLRPLPFDIGLLPLRGQALFISFLLLLLNIILSLSGYDLAFPDIWYSSLMSEKMAYFSNRIGVLSFANLPAIVLYSSRNNPLIALTSWLYSSFLLYHRWLAYISISQALLHSFIYFLRHIHLLPLKFTQAYWNVGVAATISLFLISFFSFLFLRRRFYEFFLIATGHAYLYFPTLSWRVWENHLFSIAASVCQYADEFGEDEEEEGKEHRRLMNEGIEFELVGSDDLGSEEEDIDIGDESQEHRYLTHNHGHNWNKKEETTHIIPETPSSLLPSTPHSAMGLLPETQTSHIHTDDQHQATSSSPKQCNNTPYPGLKFYIRISHGLTRRLTILSHPYTKIPVLIEAPYSSSPSHSLTTENAHLVCIVGGAGISSVLPLLLTRGGVNGKRRTVVYWSYFCNRLVNSLISDFSLSNSAMNSAPRSACRLRTSSGCFMCRKRRKKCDERKPRCAGCTRNNLKCVWPAPKSIEEKDSNSNAVGAGDMVQTFPHNSSTPFGDDSTKIGRIRSAVYGIPGIKTCMDHYLCLYFRERFMAGVLRANAHLAFHDSRHLIMVGAKASMTMRAFLATAAMHASWTNPKFRRVAMRYYNSVITGLRKVISDGEVNGDEDWLLLTTNFLVLFEINQGWNTGQNPLGATPHLDGLARILRIRIAKESQQPSGFVHPQNRISAESFVLWASSLSLFYSDIDIVGETINWDNLSFYLEPDVFPGVSIRANSPLLASNWKLHRTIFDVTRLSHKVPLDSASYLRGQELEIELIRREEDTRLDIKNSTTQGGQDQDILQQTLLYILVAQILIFKTLRPETRTHHPRIRQIVTEVMGIVRGIKIEPETKCGPYFCWPLAIISCAVETQEDVVSLREMLKRTKEKGMIEARVTSISQDHHAMDPCVEISTLEYASLKPNRHSRLSFGVIVARVILLVLALIVFALSGSVAESLGPDHCDYLQAVVLSLATFISNMILVFYVYKIFVIPQVTPELYLYEIHILLEAVTFILSIFTFFLLIGEYQTWNEFKDIVLSPEEAAAMQAMSIQVPSMENLRAATYISGIQTISAIAVPATCVVAHFRS
ncbi:hypothetical protein G7Y89_g7321 [Cudoniella acicularis]|uniref:Zn(2)-C6 fungal-type domain-containing protein n=1 Tax=Cudoniella acicularis TaxID=354080 RepID=A0A8H4W1N8_9HELO|nr:hypothetical protein G7Y89_g7321 [Cudoniella acicularis]